MEGENGGLYVPEGSVPVVGWKRKKAGGYEGLRMGGSLQKGTRNNTFVLGFVGGFQYFERKNNGGRDERIG